MGLDAWVTLVVLVVMVAAMATERTSPLRAVAGAIVVLLVTGVIDEDDLLGGISSSAPLTIAALYVLAGAAVTTAAFDRVLPLLLGHRGSGERNTLTRIAVTSGGLSALVPNSPLVAVLAPQVVIASRRDGRPASRLLLPLNYATVLGGVITLSGTSTNLIVSDLLSRTPGQEPFSFFEITPVGIWVAAAGWLTLVAVAPRLLPNRTPVEQDLRAAAKQYSVAMQVDPAGPLVDRSVLEAGLRNLEGVYLTALERGDRFEAPIAPEAVLASGDTLYFVGDVTRVLDLHRIRGLKPVADDLGDDEFHQLDSQLFEVVVSDTSDLVGSTLKESAFRARYGGAVLAIHRSGETISGKLGTIVLRAGDVLLVLAAPSFAQVRTNGNDFSIVATLEEAPPPRRRRAWIVLVTFAAVVVAAATGFTTLLTSAVVGASVLIALRVISPAEARRAVNVKVVALIALSVVLGTAVAKSGLATEVGDLLRQVGDRTGDIGLLAAVLVGTMLLSEVMANTAAAAVMFPIAVQAATGVGADPRAFAVAVLIGGSCAFLTPFGYQTNLMVYGLGGYRFSDYLRLGAPLDVVVAVVAVAVIPLVFPLR